MKNLLSSLLLASAFAANIFCQTGDSTRTNKLHSLGLYPYPAAEEFKNNILSDSLIKAQPVSADDINDSFTNTNDLEWLKDIAKNNKVVLLGEEHYHEFISNIRNRILFYLNTVDYYPLIVLEAQYSYTGYVNYYINLKDDKEAGKFFDDVMCSLVSSVEEYDLFRHIRRWNMLNPSKKITVGFSDIEHNYWATIKNILLPYFRKIDRDLEIKTDSLSEQELGALLPKFFSLLQKAKEINLTGDYPFLTPQYISNVITNLESIYNSSNYQFDYYRQKAIVRNLTDKNYLGNFLINGKALLHGGAYHMTTHFSYPENGNFLREGSYLNEDFNPTKGKVYSISFHSFFRSLGKAADINLDSCVVQGGGYRYLLGRWQTAYKEKLISCDDYLIDFEISDFHKLFLKIESGFNNSPIVINSINWQAAMNIAKQNKNINLFNIIKYWEPDHNRYDKHIFIPGSPFIEAMKRK